MIGYHLIVSPVGAESGWCCGPAGVQEDLRRPLRGQRLGPGGPGGGPVGPQGGPCRATSPDTTGTH